MQQALRRLPDELLDAKVEGRNLFGATLRDQVREPTLVVFLRHFG